MQQHNKFISSCFRILANKFWHRFVWRKKFNHLNVTSCFHWKNLYLSLKRRYCIQLEKHAKSQAKSAEITTRFVITALVRIKLCIISCFNYPFSLDSIVQTRQLFFSIVDFGLNCRVDSTIKSKVDIKWTMAHVGYNTSCN